ncbi:MAG: glycosyltransferase [Xanthomonadaceae bacterium]|jgi:glycosyltransferase involved in cell wall biosynthesis|nr:glycosyltransferase [Xanthomonadaceae bacterium]MDE2247013.1 glycosyltransferase [Xanthomonadaceae bacterium]
MKITHVVENLNRGGLERMVIDLVTLQQRQGHQCQVLCVFEAGSLAPELATAGVAVHACGKRRGLDLRALARLRQRLRGHATEVLHTHNAVAHYQSLLASAGLGIARVVNTRHGMGANRRSARREWLYRRALAGTDVVATVCEAARLDAVRRGIVPAAQAMVVPNGIRVQAFQPASQESRARLRLALGLSAQACVIGSVGRLNWAKDQAGLIRAFAIVRRRWPAAVLVLVGDGPLRSELQQCAQAEALGEHVRFLGDRGDVHELLRGFDLFALSSLSEGYSMALLEACATALPIVATAVGGNGEIVRDGINGRLVPAGDPPALAAALDELLREPVRAAALGEAARAWVVAEGSLEAMAARYARLYRPAAGATGP